MAFRTSIDVSHFAHSKVTLLGRFLYAKLTTNILFKGCCKVAMSESEWSLFTVLPLEMCAMIVIRLGQRDLTNLAATAKVLRLAIANLNRKRSLYRFFFGKCCENESER